MEEIPNILELKFAKLAPDVWEKLGSIKRTGWVNRGVRNPETVQEHTIDLRALALEVIEGTDEFSAEEREELLDMLEIHDYPEAIVGDEVIFVADGDERNKLKENKFLKEEDAMKKICEGLGDEGQKIFNLWIRFEEQGDSVAIFARQLDKFQAMQKAKEYEDAGEPVSAKEFIDYDSDKITHPILIERMNGLRI